MQSYQVRSPLEIEMDQVRFYFEPEWRSTVDEQQKGEVEEGSGAAVVAGWRRHNEGRDQAAWRRGATKGRSDWV